jgi:restriction system protein
MRHWQAIRGDFRERFRDLHGYGASARGVGAAAGMLFRFVHEMKIGDIVVSPSPLGNLIRVGRVAGDYAHDPTIWIDYPTLRSVEWVAKIDRGDLTDAARSSLRAQRSLFRVQAGAEEFRRIALLNSV